MASYVIHPIVLGSKRLDKSMMTYQHGAGEPYVIPLYAWYLESLDPDGPARLRILVDTGEAHPITSPDREEALGGRIYHFADGLARFGLSPDDIDIIIHTHLHNDHCENDAECVNARIYVHEAELERIHDPHPLDYRYLEDHILDAEERDQIETVREDCEIAPGVRVMHTPAHTPGGLTVLVDTPKGVAAITGFCVINENFQPPREVRAMELEVIPPGTCTDPCRAYDIMCAVRDAADMILPLHEPSFATGDPIGG